MAKIHDLEDAVDPARLGQEALPFDPQRELIGDSAQSVTTVEDEVARLNQALLDLEHCGATTVSLTHCPSAAREKSFVRELGKAARRRGFVTAQLSLRETSVDTLDELVAALLDALVSPSDTRPRGLLHLLDLSFARHGNNAVSRFDEAVTSEEALGDLASLCRAYLAAEDDAHREVRAFSIWTEGVELRRQYVVPGVRQPLNSRTAQRVFGDLTRIVRALGHRGLVVFLTEGDALAHRTERQRERAYTVLRELVDNFDAGRGAVSTRICLSGGEQLFEGPCSIQSLPPLLARLILPSAAEPPPPHRTWTSLIREPYEYVHRSVRAPESVKPAALRSLIRIAQGLPPVEAVTSMSVGHERIDRTITKLFDHAEMAGSVFQVLSGEYGSGKTHLLLHLAERALAQGHPVFWLNLERMNLDLGNPARHLSRVLEHSVMPKRGRPSALDRARVWTRTRSKIRALQSALEEIAESDSEESAAAKKALRIAAEAEDQGAALESFLAAQDLTQKTSGQSYRLDAYRRLLLWIELLRRLDGAEGPVLLIDEAENLYTSGVPKNERRSALRSLSFYCGGALPGACVIVAMTPPALEEMRKESGKLLREQAQVQSTLDLEDVVLFKQRLSKLRPDEVPSFSRPMRKALADKVRATHRSVRGPVEIPEWDELVKEVIRAGGPPRVLVRRLIDELEAAWWGGN